MRQIKLLFAALALVAGTGMAWADASGDCGTSLTWSYTESNHTLTIEGSGAMSDYIGTNQPWYSYKDAITTVVLPDGITHIGEYAFSDCSSLTEVNVSWNPLNPIPATNANVFSCVTLANVTLNIPAGRKYLYEAAAVWQDFNIVSPYSGVCGASGNIENVTWVFDPATHTLTISGTGAMVNYDSHSGIWRDYKNDIQHVVICIIGC